MKLEKKHWAMLIAGAVVLFLVYWFFFRKKKTESGFVANLPMIGESGYSVGRGYDPGQNLLLYQGRPLVGGESGYSAGDIESGFVATNKAVRRFPLMPPLPNGYVIPASKVKKGAGCWNGYSQSSPDPVTGDVTCSKMKTD